MLNFVFVWLKLFKVESDFFRLLYILDVTDSILHFLILSANIKIPIFVGTNGSMRRKTIIDNKEDILQQAVAAMQEKKAKNIISLDLSGVPDAVTGYFLICNASSKIQVNAIYDYVVEMVTKHCREHPYHREGYENSEWILIDYINVVVHIFLEETRSFYNLESLWADAETRHYKSDE